MILRGSDTVLVQGITGKQGTFWSERMRDYGTNIVGGVNPKRAGEQHLGLPVWATARDAARETSIDAAVMFIPPFGVKEAALDAIEAGIGKIVCLTEHVPVHDTMYVLAAARERGAHLHRAQHRRHRHGRANASLGFMPAFNPRVFQPGSVGVISRSGSLGTLLCLNLVQAGLGISAFIGIGGDPIIGTTTKDALMALDPSGNQGHRSRRRDRRRDGGGGGRVRQTMKKPVAAFIAGAASPPGKRMGHAGAIVMGDKGSYAGKKAALEAAGVTVCATPNGVAEGLKRAERPKISQRTRSRCASVEYHAFSAVYQGAGPSHKTPGKSNAQTYCLRRGHCRCCRHRHACPSPAQTPAPPPFATTKVEGTDNVYIFRNGNHQPMFIVTKAGVIATDPVAYGRPTGGQTYVDEIKKVTNQPIKYLIYSHHHYDHIAGGKAFKDAGARVVAHERAKERLAV